jgi:hypothetical protein
MRSCLKPMAHSARPLLASDTLRIIFGTLLSGIVWQQKSRVNEPVTSAMMDILVIEMLV